MTNQEVINIIEDVSVNTNCDNCFYKYDNTCEDCRVETALNIAIEALENQKTGHWIDVTNGRGGHKCDNCHEYAPSYQSGDEYLTKYCPNCGAKME